MPAKKPLVLALLLAAASAAQDPVTYRATFEDQGYRHTRLGASHPDAAAARAAFAALPAHERQHLLFLEVIPAPPSPRPAPATPRSGWSWIATFEEQGYTSERSGPLFESEEAAKAAFRRLSASERFGLQSYRFASLTSEAPRRPVAAEGGHGFRATFLDQGGARVVTARGFASQEAARAALHRAEAEALGTLVHLRWLTPDA